MRFTRVTAFSLADTPGSLGAGYFIPIFGVPFLLVTHVLLFRLFMRKEGLNPLTHDIGR